MGVLQKLRGVFSSKNGEVQNNSNQDNPNLGYDELEEYHVLVSPDGVNDEHVLEMWSLDYNTPHRSYGPAIVTRDKATEKVISEVFCRHGMTHRKSGPAEIEYDIETGVTTLEKYYQSSKLHNENGPAIIERDRKTGEITSEQFFIKGKKISSESIDFQPTQP